MDDLSSDADPLVRESAVRRMGRLGLLGSQDRLNRLLQDANTNVRMAVLQALTSSQDDKSLETICAYLRHEPQEELLVRGIKYLATLGGADSTHEVLATLSGHSGWRVRAAVFDAVKALGEAGDTGLRLKSSSTPSTDNLTAAVIAGVADADPFVTARASAALPAILTKRNAATIAEIFARDLDRLDAVLADGRRRCKREFSS
jgi:HEAT repeat protein